ncbi:MAG: Fic family protein [Spirochaetales bacterium]|nr:Fic family protein [Spirochaetales bacterium]
MYTPPFSVSSKIIDLISRISELIGEINSLESSPRNIQLRKENRIKTIHSSLAIENNSLSLEQITAIIEGKRVLGAPNEIQEVLNAVQTYDLLLSLDSTSEKDLLRAHSLMMNDLVAQNGKYRTGGVGIFDDSEVVHIAPPAERVPALMADLFDWLRNSDVHPLIKSCVFHYEFEFIHPFQDGNGRMGRLWQTVILKDWKDVFAWLPVETLIKENQAEYYKTLNTSDSNADSTIFTEFMLELLEKSIEEIIATENRVTVKVTQKVTVNQQKIIEAIKENPYITQDELSQKIGIARKNIISNMKKLQEKNIIRRVGADKNGWWKVCK